MLELSRSNRFCASTRADLWMNLNLLYPWNSWHQMNRSWYLSLPKSLIFPKNWLPTRVSDRSLTFPCCSATIPTHSMFGPKLVYSYAHFYYCLPLLLWLSLRFYIVLDCNKSSCFIFIENNLWKSFSQHALVYLNYPLHVAVICIQWVSTFDDASSCGAHYKRFL